MICVLVVRYSNKGGGTAKPNDAARTDYRWNAARSCQKEALLGGLGSNEGGGFGFSYYST